MKATSAASLIVALIVSSACGPSGNVNQNPTNSANISTPQASNPNWPNRDWITDPASTTENGTGVVFKTEKVVEITMAIPADWSKMGNKSAFLLYKTPTIDERFGNLIVQSSNTKPGLMAPPDPKRNFDYSGFEPDAAFKHYLERKNGDADSGRIQQIPIDGVWGVLEQVVPKVTGESNSSPKEQTALWHWTTFIKTIAENNKVEIIMGHPAVEVDKYRTIIGGLVNSAKIKRLPGAVLLESQPQ